ncbi:MAG TPA: TonB-dependent receptor [Gemmatimonadaceae bacterium]|nr:TonB-dependent receptor [Gemmatimonadaceae bacterium]
MHSFSPKVISSHTRATACLALAAAFCTLPIDRVSAQAATDTTTARSKALGRVVISATRTEQELRSLPTHVVVIDRPAIAMSAAATVPDLLRSIPGFTTRDYQSGLISGSSQSMVSFRGLGGSSAGRALVLLDGVPAGDPFSGWLDWGRIPLTMLESAEVIRGGGSMIWGSRSLGGVVNLRTISPRQNEMHLLLEGGSLGTTRAAGSASIRHGTLSATVGGDAMETDGFVVLRQAGTADEPENTIHRALSAKLGWDASTSLQTWLGGTTFDGGRPPIGTDDQQRFDEARGGMRWITPRGAITLAAFTNRRFAYFMSDTYNADRSSRTPSRSNGTPAHSTGGSLQWTQTAFDRHELTAGADFSLASGSVSELFAIVDGDATRERKVHGAQQLSGFFVQDAADLGHGVRMVASARADRVRNQEGHRIMRALDQDSILSDSTFEELTASKLTYSLGLRWQQTGWLGWRGSVYDAFRAPSMYEMYYPRFSSRGGVTEANSTLRPERLHGGEVGADLTLASGLIARVTTYTSRVADPIMDVTIGTASATQAQVIQPCGLMPKGQTCGQRQNVHALRSRGLETEIDWLPVAAWNLTAGYAFTPTRVMAPGHPADGMQAIRAARHTGTAGLTYSPRWATIGIDAKRIGSRFDDDLNSVKLDAFTLLGFRVNRSIGRGVTAYVRVENALNKEFEVARTRAGLADLGAPRWVTAGVRTSW